MNAREVQRAQLLERVKHKDITLKKASELLNLSYPQIKRLWAKFKIEGAKGLISKKRGKRSNRAVSIEIRKEVVNIIRSCYEGCKPLFVSEKLRERHSFDYSPEFIRQLMIENHLWIPKKPKKNIHQRRQRRECTGELVQIDASDHDWFEDRGPRCHLHLLIDDATSIIYGAQFAEEETTEGYFRACLPYFEKIGLPISLYADKRGTFIVNQGKKKGETQFSRAMKELGVTIIFAQSPQAKGRVERVFGTLQERLVWEMRIAGISTIEEANKFVPSFLEKFNNRFCVEPTNTFNAHRQLNQNQDLKYILCRKDKRKVSRQLEVCYDKQIYQLRPPEHLKEILKGISIDVLTLLNGKRVIQHKGMTIPYRIFGSQLHKPKQPKPEELLESWKEPQQHKVNKNHPWKRRKLNPNTMKRCYQG